MWFEAQNRKLAEKRRDEETRHIMNEWSEARARMEAEIQRKKEHVNQATNFAKARGFVRTNWKSKNFNPKDDPTQYDSSTDESELAAREREEMEDQVDGMTDEYQSPKKASPKKTADSPPQTQFFYDVTQQIDHVTHKGSTEEQLATLQAIADYNKNLPKRRKGKDELPEISTSNITATYRVEKDHKKKTIDIKATYKPVGIVDGFSRSQSATDKYGISARQAALQRSASAKKIADLRMHYGALIGPATPMKVDPAIAAAKAAGLPVEEPKVVLLPEVDNPFNEDTLSRDISLSVFCSPNAVVQSRPRPATA